MAAARVLVAPNLPSLREVLNSEFSFLYEFPEKRSLEKYVRYAVQAVKQGKSDEMGLTARQMVKTHFTWDIRMKKICNELNES